MFAYLGLKAWENDRVSGDFLASVSAYEAVFQERLNAYMIELDSIARFRANYAFSQNQFKRFVEPIIQNYREIHVVHWVAHVPQDQRSALEGRGTGDGSASLPVLEMTGSGMQAAQSREHYFPIVFSVSNDQGDASQGLDIASIGGWQSRLLSFAEEGGAHFVSAGTDPLSAQSRFSYLVMPVYVDGGIFTEQSSLDHLLGFVVAYLDVGESFEYSIARLRDGGIHVDLFDEDTAHGQRLLYSHQAKEFNQRDRLAFVNEDFQFTSKIRLADHWLEIRFEPVEQFFEQHSRVQPWWAVVFGTLATFLSLVYSYRRQRYTETIESLVAARTEELANATAQQKAIVDNAVDGIITINERGLVSSFNPAAEGIFGYTASEVVGCNVSMLMNHEDARLHDGYLKRYMETGEAKVISVGREVVGRRKDGTLFPMDLAVSELNLRGGRYFTGMVRDITERKRVEKLKNEFVSTVSHELRTPLTSIRGALGLVLGGASGEVPERLRAMLTIASNNTERLLLLINDILDLQKIESGKLEFHYSMFDVCDFVKKVVEENHGFAHQHSVMLLTTHLPNSAAVYGDQARLTQVLTNLISNAVKFSNAGGRVEVAAALQHNNVRISVKDYGVGIPAAFHSKMFDRFTQVDASDARKAGGTGLGLNISKSIMERHGGRIDFVSHEGIGSMFYIDLPMQHLGENAAISTVHARFSKGLHPRILIVEDEADVGVVLLRMLTEHGFTCDVAETAAEAREMMQCQRYEMVTLDIMLPDEDGMSLLRYMREQEAYRDVPVIVISAKADETRQSLNGNAIGIVDWLTKPVDVVRLDLALAQALNSQIKPKILLVEDDGAIAEIVIQVIDAKADVTLASSLNEARSVLAEESFELIVLDVGLPDGSGLELLSQLKAADHPPRVVIFSAQDVAEDIAQQVDAVLSKATTSNDELLAQVLSYIPMKKDPL